MTTFASSESAGRIRVAYGRVIIGTGAVFLGIGVFMRLLADWADFGFLSGASLGIVLFAAQSQLIGYKRYLYVDGRVSQAMIASIVYAGLGLTGAMTLIALRQYSEVALVACASLAALIAAFPLAVRMIGAKGTFLQLIRGRPELGRYTSWAVATSLPAAAAMQAIYWVAGITSSVETVGQLKLYEQMMMPVGQALGAFVLLDQVKCAAAFGEGRYSVAFEYIRTRVLRYVIVSALYVTAVLTAITIARSLDFDWARISILGLAVYGGGTIAFGAAAANNVALKMSRRPEFLTLGYTAMALFVLSSPLWSGQVTTVGFAGLVACGWCAHLAILMTAVRLTRRHYCQETRPNGALGS